MPSDSASNHNGGQAVLEIEEIMRQLGIASEAFSKEIDERVSEET